SSLPRFSLFVVFFFQAEDGIRDFHVTGVQTCALPIYHQPRRARGQVERPPPEAGEKALDELLDMRAHGSRRLPQRAWIRGSMARSEERRVGKECRSRGSPYHEKKQNEYAERRQSRNDR